MRTVFSRTEQIRALGFVVACLLFCLSFVGVDPDVAADVGPGFVSISPAKNACWVAMY